MITLVGRYSLVSNKSLKFLPQKFGYWYFFIILFLISGLRYYVGYDYVSYYTAITTRNTWALKHFEIIPRMILKLSISLDSVWIFFLIFSFFILFLVFKTIEDNSVDVYCSIAVFFTLFFLESLSIIRQWLALAIVFYSFKYIKNKKIIRFCISICIATCCHTSAAIGFILYPIYWYLPVRVSVFYVIMSYIFNKRILDFGLSILKMKKYRVYINNIADMNAGATKTIYFIYLICLLNIVIFQFMKNKSKDQEKLLSLTCIGTSFIPLLGTQTGLRLGDYFLIFNILLVPYSARVFKEKKIKYLYLIPFYLFFFLYLYIDSKNNQGYTNYQFIFMQ